MCSMETVVVLGFDAVYGPILTDELTLTGLLAAIVIVVDDDHTPSANAFQMFTRMPLYPDPSFIVTYAPDVRQSIVAPPDSLYFP